MWDAYQILLTVVTGVTKSIVRFILVLITVLFSLPKIDRSPFPAWFEEYLLLDTGSKAYYGTVVLYHTYNHPVMRVFAWIVQEDAAARAEPSLRAEYALVLPARRRVANRFWKAWMLHKNPALRIYSSKFVADPLEEVSKDRRKEIAKSVKLASKDLVKQARAEVDLIVKGSTAALARLNAHAAFEEAKKAVEAKEAKEAHAGKKHQEVKKQPVLVTSTASASTESAAKSATWA